MTTDIEGIDRGPVTEWFVHSVPDVAPPLSFELIAGGHSNLTYRVADGRGGRWVLRRPPLGQVLATAHDMGREHRIIAALGPTDVPVPPAVGYCDDENVNGAPFYVMEFVDGIVPRDAQTAEKSLDTDARHVAGESLAEVLAAIHAVDVDAVGLGDLGRKDGYIARQLKRWHTQWESSKTRELPLVDEVHEQLAADVPEQGPATIVHGDYRLDNCILGEDGTVRAVLDWELCTLGDPLADLGLLQVYWTDPDDPHAALLAPTTTLEGFPRRHEIVQRYAERSGRDVSNLDYYVAFGYWKLACIIEGVYARYVGGAMGRERSGFDGFAQQVERLTEQAAGALSRVR